MKEKTRGRGGTGVVVDNRCGMREKVTVSVETLILSWTIAAMTSLEHTSKPTWMKHYTAIWQYHWMGLRAAHLFGRTGF